MVASENELALLYRQRMEIEAEKQYSQSCLATLEMNLKSLKESFCTSSVKQCECPSPEQCANCRLLIWDFDGSSFESELLILTQKTNARISNLKDILDDKLTIIQTTESFFEIPKLFCPSVKPNHSNTYIGGRVHENDFGYLLDLIKIKEDCNEMTNAVKNNAKSWHIPVMYLLQPFLSLRLCHGSSACREIMAAASSANINIRIWPLDALYSRLNLSSDQVIKKAEALIATLKNTYAINAHSPFLKIGYDETIPLIYVALHKALAPWLIVEDDESAEEILRLDLKGIIGCITYSGNRHVRGRMLIRGSQDGLEKEMRTLLSAIKNRVNAFEVQKNATSTLRLYEEYMSMFQICRRNLDEILVSSADISAKIVSFTSQIEYISEEIKETEINLNNLKRSLKLSVLRASLYSRISCFCSSNRDDIWSQQKSISLWQNELEKELFELKEKYAWYSSVNQLTLVEDTRLRQLSVDNIKIKLESSSQRVASLTNQLQEVESEIFDLRGSLSAINAEISSTEDFPMTASECAVTELREFVKVTSMHLSMSSKRRDKALESSCTLSSDLDAALREEVLANRNFIIKFASLGRDAVKSFCDSFMDRTCLLNWANREDIEGDYINIFTQDPALHKSVIQEFAMEERMLLSQITLLECSITDKCHQFWYTHHMKENLRWSLRNKEKNPFHPPPYNEIAFLELVSRFTDSIESCPYEILLHSLQEKINQVNAVISSLESDVDHGGMLIASLHEKTYIELRQRFGRYFCDLVKGKNVDLVRIDERLESGLKFSFRTTKNILFASAQDIEHREINELSGGQKALLGLAFVFACALVKSQPLILMDEIDAALDENNQSIVSRIVSKLFKSSCVFCVSHHPQFLANAAQTINLSISEGSTVICTEVAVRNIIISMHDERRSQS